MSRIEGRNSNIDLPASPYTILAVEPDGVIHTPRGAMTVTAVESLLADRIGSWIVRSSDVPSERAAGEVYESMLDVLSLMAEIDLERARALWSRSVAPDMGMPRLLDRSSEQHEVRYARNLAAQRSLDEDALSLHILEQAEFMEEWASARRLLVAAATTD